MTPRLTSTMLASAIFGKTLRQPLELTRSETVAVVLRPMSAIGGHFAPQMLPASISHFDAYGTPGRSARAATRASKTRVESGFLRCQIPLKVLDQILLVGIV